MCSAPPNSRNPIGSMDSFRALLAAMLLLLACGGASAATLAEIQNNIQAIINNANSSVQWSVLIENQWGNQTYFSLNADTPRRPASNTKIFTTAGAMGINGPGYTWRGYQLQSSSTASPMEDVLTYSDNTLADELYGLVPGGGTAIINWCSARGINMSGAQMYDGSGLDYNNRFTSRQTLQLVRYQMNTYGYSQWATHLAIGCVKGTLASRLCDANTSTGPYTSNRVHAKTGTLTNGGVLSLGGYIDNYFDGQRYYFSIYTNGVPIDSQSDTMARMDLIVKEISKPGIPNPGSPAVVVDNTSGGFTASSNWFASTSVAGYYGTNYHARATASVSDPATWSATLPSDGSYKVYARWTTGSNRATAAPFIVYHSGGSTTVNMNQQSNNGTWVLLGTFNMYQGTADRVKLSCWTTAGYYVIADAVQFVKQ